MDEVTISSAQSEILFRAASPELFRVNAFRLLEMPVDASQRDIARRQEIIEKASRIGLRIPPGSGRALPLDGAVNLDALREAVQRMNDPERRFVDELFWFWPHQQGGNQTDEALLALSRGDIKTASDNWLRQEQYSDANVSMHNLAVLSHAAALDLELDTAHRIDQSNARQQVDLYWRQAFRRWKVLLNDEGFWSRVTQRLRDLDDPRLTTGVARRIRTLLPQALVLINAQLALRAAESGRLTEAQRYVQLARESGFDSHDVDESLNRAIEPIRERIKILGQTAEQEADRNPAEASKPAHRLIEQTRGLLQVLDTMLPVGNATRESMHDEVARRALACIIPFGNKTEDWQATVDLLKLTLPIPVSEILRTRIQEGLSTVEGNLKNQLCWFCKTRPLVKSATVLIQMYGNVTRTRAWNGVHVQWQNYTALVPRCAECKATHSKVGSFSSIVWTIGVLLSLAGCYTVNNSARGVDQYGYGLFIGIVIFTRIITSRLSKELLENALPESEKLKFPLVVELKRQGWAVGARPSTQ